jgi:hypothetical protein
VGTLNWEFYIGIDLGVRGFPHRSFYVNNLTTLQSIPAKMKAPPIINRIIIFSVRKLDETVLKILKKWTNHSKPNIVTKTKSKEASKLHANPKIADTVNKIFFIFMTKKMEAPYQL